MNHQRMVMKYLKQVPQIAGIPLLAEGQFPSQERMRSK
jgi:hypothetical protein